MNTLKGCELKILAAERKNRKEGNAAWWIGLRDAR